METNKIIAQNYQIIKPLFQINNYLYVQLCSLKTYEVFNAALYVYENEDPSQSLKMLTQKLDLKTQHKQSNYLVFPSRHIKEEYNQKNLSVFFINDYLMPLSRYQKRSFSSLQFLEILHGALNCLNQLHSQQIIHGNISLKTSYLVQHRREPRCRFSLNILDTSHFIDENSSLELEEFLFKSQGQSLGLNVSFKDDLESLVYVITHLISRGKLFTVQRFQLEWMNQAELLRWKTCEFFKEMIKIVPQQLQILIEIYTIAKSLRRNQKPEYVKIIKKVIDLMLASQKTSSKQVKQNSKTVKQTSKPVKQTSKQPQDENKVYVFEQINQSDIEIKFKKSSFFGSGGSKNKLGLFEL